ncbi:hypothetical protein [Chengkuizengella axinellae]|uniref:DUF4309 domain-containing protein n=1 Tax=Chengkuizengella axinellae TaxID=3064388 RepID=A0ABT9IYJ1_9BACL|nr:hypothetical protein [Chengkuizengella sp. 2205SS18-9]MDP5274217.1 hypothetical protein [Chengkuizengella sp. 2205SS18-9]
MKFISAKYIILLAISISILFLLNIFGTYTKTPIEAIEEVRDEIGFILHEMDVDGDKILMYSRDTGEESQQLNVDFVKKSWMGWTRGYGGSGSIPSYSENKFFMDVDSISSMYFPSTKDTPIGDTPFPMFVGVLNNPNIETITMLSHLTGEEQTVNLVQGSGYRIWYLFVTKEDGYEFTMKLLSSNGDIVYEEDINEEFLFELDGE